MYSKYKIVVTIEGIIYRKITLLIKYFELTKINCGPIDTRPISLITNGWLAFLHPKDDHNIQPEKKRQCGLVSIVEQFLLTRQTRTDTFSQFIDAQLYNSRLPLNGKPRPVSDTRRRNIPRHILQMLHWILMRITIGCGKNSVGKWSHDVSVRFELSMCLAQEISLR